MAPGVSSAKLGKLLGISFQRVYQQVKAGNLPEPVDGRWDPYIAVPHYVKQLREKVAGKTDTSLTEERKRLTTLQADKTEHELAILKGEHIHTDIIGDYLERVFVALRQRILSIPTKAATLVMGQKSLAGVRDAIEEQLHEALSELSELDVEALGKGKAEATETPAKVQRGKVGGRKKKVKPGK
jgi:phage terminase Nu1 subunit (DNA packaging protein)